MVWGVVSPPVWSRSRHHWLVARLFPQHYFADPPSLAVLMIVRGVRHLGSSAHATCPEKQQLSCKLPVGQARQPPHSQQGGHGSAPAGQETRKSAARRKLQLFVLRGWLVGRLFGERAAVAGHWSAKARRAAWLRHQGHSTEEGTSRKGGMAARYDKLAGTSQRERGHRASSGTAAYRRRASGHGQSGFFTPRCPSRARPAKGGCSGQ